MNNQITNSHWIVPYTPPKSADTFLASEVEKATEKVYKKCLQLSLASNGLLAADAIPKSSVSLSLRRMMNDLTKLQNAGYFSGEVLIARGADSIFTLRSEDVVEASKGGQAQFFIGSVSKQFFAVALLRALYFYSKGDSESQKAAEAIKLLHTPLSHFFPKDAPLWSSHMPDWANQITLHHLLSHTSGLPDFANECDEYQTITESGRHLFEIPQKNPIENILKIIANKPLHFKPGTKYSYSNTGYSLIAEVIKQLTKMPLSLYMEKTLFEPFGLSSTFHVESGIPLSLKESDPRFSRLVLPLGYDPTKDQKILKKSAAPHDDMSWVYGAGSLISTAQDLSTWNRALHRTKSLLPSALYQLFMKPNFDNYAYGIGSHDFYGGSVHHHSGHIGNYRTELVYLPDHDISLIFMNNVDVESLQLHREEEDLMEKLKATIPDKRQRQQEIGKMLLQRYPDQRIEPREQIFFSFFRKG
jgi:CubicO group peptidase (beta-lactamase class C family)